MKKKENDRSEINKLFLFIVFLAIFSGTLVVLIWLDYRPESDSRTTEKKPTITTYTPLRQDKPAEPHFVHEGSIDLEKLKKDGRILLCRGEKACRGVFWKYEQVFRKAIGPPTAEFKFDDPRDSESTRGDRFMGWVLSDGYEIALSTLHQNSSYWRKRGKYPEVVVILVDPR